MIPKSHPRYKSLKARERIEEGVRKGVTSHVGLIAHGRGEAFDYLIGEKTNEFGLKAIEVAAALLLFAKNPVISVNGNVAALAPREIVKLAKTIPAKLEVNIFYSSKERELKIKKELIKRGAKEVLMPQKNYKIRYLESNRRFVNKDGIYKADVVFVPLEDGDRTEALRKNGKKVITVDLNPISRTAKNADITIVDNVMRVVPLLIKKIEQCKKYDRDKLKRMIKNYNNKKILNDSIRAIKKL